MALPPPRLNTAKGQLDPPKTGSLHLPYARPAPRRSRRSRQASLGIDTETLAGFALPGMMANDNDLIRSPPTPVGRHPACGMVLLSLNPQLPRRRGFARRARVGCLL